MQVDPIKPILKAPKAERLKQCFDQLLSNLAFKLDLRRYSEAARILAPGGTFVMTDNNPKVGRCILTVSKPVLKAPMVSAPETRIL